MAELQTKKRRWWVLGAGLLAVIVIGIIWYMRRNGSDAVVYRTASIKRGDLTSSIPATGTLEPEEVVDIGAQVAGQIVSFGKDAVGKSIDYGSQVEADMVLATIDPALYDADAKSAQAQLDSAKAGVTRAQADLAQLQAKLYQSQRDWDRAQQLGPSDALAMTTYDAYKATFDQAKANVAIGAASIEQAKAAVTQAAAAQLRADRNLGYTVIKSPVKGVIIDRRVNVGQTVVSSLNAPSLFLLAKDLRRMQVWVAVNEADIGQIDPGQAVTFMVDTFPGRTFRGTVDKIRLNAQMTQNVVTFTVEVETDNRDLTLKPYVTANVQFIVGQREGVLTVPAAALRYTPATEQITPAARAEYAAVTAGGERRGGRASSAATTASEGAVDVSDSAGGAGHADPAASAPAVAASQPAEGSAQPSTASSHTAAATTRGANTRPARHSRRSDAPRRGFVWVKDGAYVRPIAVRSGLSDGTATEVIGDDLKDGMEVVVGEEPREAGSASGTNNPFAPKFPSRGGGGSRSGGGSGGSGAGRSGR